MAASRIETPFTAMGSNNQEPAKAKGKAVLDVASIHVVDANLLQKAYPAQQSAERCAWWMGWKGLAQLLTRPPGGRGQLVPHHSWRLSQLGLII